MSIASALETHYHLMNNDQRKIISHQHGPLLIIAGPGSGKTWSLILLAMKLLQGQTQPSELLLCTYTEKAACEMRDRLMAMARDVGYQQDLASLRIGTIHGICQQLIAENIHFTRIENDFVTLDQFTQQLLIFEEINMICPPKMKRFFQYHWGAGGQDASDWEIAKELGSCFDKITEELLFDKLKATYAQTTPSSQQTENDRLRYYLTYAYSKYQKLLEQRNCLDFAHLQKCIYNLLCDPATFPYLTRGIRYVLVDEYQDTNYIQEKILTRLASATDENNLFVVGDEDQALYRFRGATVRNILKFEQNFPNCKSIRLMTNYRSHQSIIDTYNEWISSINWSNPQGIPFRTEKSVRSNKSTHDDYPAVCTLTSQNIYEEAEQFAELVASLKQEGKIQDYSQVALLLYSVKPRFSTDYIQALEKRNIPSICPRAEFYFEQEEVSLMIGCFARILDFEDEHYEIAGTYFPKYLRSCREQLHKASYAHLPLRTMLFHMREEITQSADQPEARGKPLEDYFYRLITLSPFLHSIKDARPHQEAQPQNLKIFSRLLQMFQRYYRYTGITQHNCQDVARDFFQKFLHLLYNNGFNQHEGSQQSFPQGHVPILTIHQAKGLEFPVVVVGGLNRLFSSSDSQKQQVWQEFAHLPPYEPQDRIASFDLRRLYYVAFSRAEKLLVLAAAKKPDAALASLWKNLPAWSPAQISMLPNSQDPKPPFTPQPRYGFTSHIQLYETCPRQFQFFRHYNFTSGHNEKYFSGQLVHHTLEHIHRIARDGGLTNLSEQTVYTIFQHKYQALLQSYLTPVDESQKAKAWRQVLHYFQQNQEELHNIADAELQVQIDKNNHVLTGKIDLLVKTTGGTDLIDFKTLPRQREDSVLVEQYERQLHFYAHALESHHRQRPKRLFLYWTAEERKERALMEIPYQAEKMEKISLDLDRIVSNIEKKNFHVQKPPAFETCQCCHIRHLCQQDRVI